MESRTIPPGGTTERQARGTVPPIDLRPTGRLPHLVRDEAAGSPR